MNMLKEADPDPWPEIAPLYKIILGSLEKFHKEILGELGSKAKPFTVKESFFKQNKVELLVFDFKKAKEDFFSGNDEVALKILQRMQDEIFIKPTGLVYRLIKSYQEKDLVLFHRNAHSLKGSVKMFCGEKLASLAFAVQLET